MTVVGPEVSNFKSVRDSVDRSSLKLRLLRTRYLGDSSQCLNPARVLHVLLTSSYASGGSLRDAERHGPDFVRVGSHTQALGLRHRMLGQPSGARPKVDSRTCRMDKREC